MPRAANLVLIGPTGAGKSSVGRCLARRLGLAFADADGEIEARAGVTIAMIFELEGEAGFREREHRVLAELCAGRGQVIATGAGAVLREENRRLLRDAGVVVMLEVSVAEQLRRLARDRDRPLLAVADRRAQLERLAREREPLYRALADVVVSTEGGSALDACRRVLAALAERELEIAA
ncbi:MAG: shikimate kinase [Xanthomonadales bacterium]|nr:shikimate kinase [Xanthomonadales bacterium]